MVDWNHNFKNKQTERREKNKNKQTNERRNNLSQQVNFIYNLLNYWITEIPPTQSEVLRFSFVRI